MAKARSPEARGLSLRAAAAADAERIASWLNAPRVFRYLTSNLRHGGMTAALVRSGLRRPDQSWHIIEAEGEPIGFIAFDSIDREDATANMWYAIGDDRYLSRGLAAQAIALLLARNPLGLVTATAWVGAPNAASVACLEQAGFRRVGTITRAFNAEGKRSDRIVFEKVLRPA